jgi:membrane protein DedA with SNARE-associated domain
MQILQSFVEQFTYLGVFLVLAAGGLGLPIPEEMAIIAAGVMSHEGLMAPWPGLLVCLLGVLSGDVVLYWTGRNGGERVLRWRPVRRLMTPDREHRLKSAYHRHAVKTIVTARHVTGLRAAAFLTAGIVRVPFWKFLLTDGLTAMLGIPFSFALAYFFTDHVKTIFANVHRIERWIGLLVILGVAIAVFVTVRKRDRHVVEEIDGPAGHSLDRLIRPSRHAPSRR